MIYGRAAAAGSSAYRIRWLVVHGSYAHLVRQASSERLKLALYLRSLSTGETLVYELGIFRDAEVGVGLGV